MREKNSHQFVFVPRFRSNVACQICLLKNVVILMRVWQRYHAPMGRLLHCICKVDKPLMNHYEHIHTHNHFNTHGQKYTRICIVYNVYNLIGHDNVKCVLTLPSHSHLLICSCVLSTYDCRLDKPHNPVETVVILTARAMFEGCQR